MIERAILLKDVITEFYDTYSDKLYEDDILDDDNWAVLNDIKAFFDKMKQATKILESSSGCLDRVLLVIDMVLRQFEVARSKYKDHLILALML